VPSVSPNSEQQRTSEADARFEELSLEVGRLRIELEQARGTPHRILLVRPPCRCGSGRATLAHRLRARRARTEGTASNWNAFAMSPLASI